MNEQRNKPLMPPADPDSEPTDANPVPLSPTDPKRRTSAGDTPPAGDTTQAVKVPVVPAPIAGQTGGPGGALPGRRRAHRAAGEEASRYRPAPRFRRGRIARRAMDVGPRMPIAPSPSTLSDSTTTHNLISPEPAFRLPGVVGIYARGCVLASPGLLPSLVRAMVLIVPGPAASLLAVPGPSSYPSGRKRPDHVWSRLCHAPFGPGPFGPAASEPDGRWYRPLCARPYLVYRWFTGSKRRKLIAFALSELHHTQDERSGCSTGPLLIVHADAAPRDAGLREMIQ